jgi:hypothetical protein
VMRIASCVECRFTLKQEEAREAVLCITQGIKHADLQARLNQ